MRAWRRRRLGVPERRRSRWRRLIVRVVAIALAALVAGPPLFIATRCYSSVTPERSGRAALTVEPAAVREESFTFLTLPEWFIVYSSEEYGRFIGRDAPSRFPYLGSIAQYWTAYDAVCQVTRREYAFQTGYHVMLGVIGASFTAENSVKAVYENSMGRIVEWLSSTDTPEDQWAARTAQEYGAFLHTVPWYQFPFAARLGTLWRETPMWGPHLLRKWERRVVLSGEYLFKAGYSGLMGLATSTAYAPEDLQVHAVVAEAPDVLFSREAVARVRALGPDTYEITMPRYEAFTKAALDLDSAGVRIVDIAGNDELMVTVIGSDGLTLPAAPVRLVSTLPILTEPGRTRFALRTPLTVLHDTLAALRAGGATIEHLYDY
jgi:hypothetical protein